MITKPKRKRRVRKPRSLSKAFRLYYRGDHWSYLWQTLRNACIKFYGPVCQKCKKVLDTEVIHIDHIYPKSQYPEREFDFSNLQVLCGPCNIEKSDKNSIDYRGDTPYRVSN